MFPVLNAGIASAIALNSRLAHFHRAMWQKEHAFNQSTRPSQKEATGAAKGRKALKDAQSKLAMTMFDDYDDDDVPTGDITTETLNNILAACGFLEYKQEHPNRLLPSLDSNDAGTLQPIHARVCPRAHARVCCGHGTKTPVGSYAFHTSVCLPRSTRPAIFVIRMGCLHLCDPGVRIVSFSSSRALYSRNIWRIPARFGCCST